MATHELKIWPEHFVAINAGRKTMQLRKEDDRHFLEGDGLILREGDEQRVRGFGWTRDKGNNEAMGPSEK